MVHPKFGAYNTKSIFLHVIKSSGDCPNVPHQDTGPRIRPWPPQPFRSTVTMAKESQDVTEILRNLDPIVLQTLSNVAVSEGMVFLKDGIGGAAPPFASIVRLFDTLAADPGLAKTLNQTAPSGAPIYKNANIPRLRRRLHRPLLLDLSLPRIVRIPAQVQDSLGLDFKAVLSFYDAVLEAVPLLLRATSNAIGHNVEPLHRTQQFNLRLCDYSADNHCGVHCDYGTVSVLFQDQATGGLEIKNTEGIWVTVPPEASAVVVWGRCAAVFSGGRIKVLEHRVKRRETRRSAVVLFVEADPDVPLQPLDIEAAVAVGFSKRIMRGKVSVGRFKEEMIKLRRYRTGSEVADAIYGKLRDKIGSF